MAENSASTHDEGGCQYDDIYPIQLIQQWLSFENRNEIKLFNIFN